MGDNRALLRVSRAAQGILDDAEGDPKAPGLVFRVQAGADGNTRGSVRPATEAWTKGTVDSCFLCEGARYIPVSERAEIGPVMFPLDVFPGDWAACPECNAGAIDPSAEERN